MMSSHDDGLAEPSRPEQVEWAGPPWRRSWWWRAPLLIVFGLMALGIVSELGDDHDALTLTVLPCVIVGLAGALWWFSRVSANGRLPLITLGCGMSCYLVILAFVGLIAPEVLVDPTASGRGAIFRTEAGTRLMMGLFLGLAVVPALIMLFLFRTVGRRDRTTDDQR